MPGRLRCRENCDKMFKNESGRVNHERFCKARTAVAPPVKAMAAAASAGGNAKIISLLEDEAQRLTDEHSRVRGALNYLRGDFVE